MQHQSVRGLLKLSMQEGKEAPKGERVKGISMKEKREEKREKKRKNE